MKKSVKVSEKELLDVYIKTMKKDGTQKEVAKSLGISLGEVTSRIAALRRDMEEYHDVILPSACQLKQPAKRQKRKEELEGVSSMVSNLLTNSLIG